MGTTLTNGVYLPNEGERNCYAGLKTNWEILDQKVADVTALQQAVAGALHRKIVESLPTTDIDPNTIYMILSGTSATENVYNEFMYVNNAWELIGTSATDLTNYYTKSEVDGKLLLKANDSDVVHKSGNETIAGEKTFQQRPIIFNSNATVQADVPNLMFKNPLVERASTTLEGEQTILFTDKNASNIASIQAKTYTSGTSDIILTSYSETSEQAVRTTGIVIRRTPTASKFHGYSDNITSLGDTNRRWSKVYATNYYYGSDNIEFSTKFVTTDTAQTVTGSKTFSSNVNVYNSDNTADTANIILKNSKAERGTEFTEQSINFVDKNNNALAKINCYGSGNYTRLHITAYDSNNNSDGFFIRKTTTGTAILPTTSSAVAIGNSTFPYYNIQSNRFNGLEPSSLSLPVIPSSSSYVDISAYITVLDNSGANLYTPPSNGYITFYVHGNQVQISHNYGLQYKSSVQSGAVNKGFYPVCGGVEYKIHVSASSIDKFWFIPCQGNV